jgi:hypothetical protein
VTTHDSGVQDAYIPWLLIVPSYNVEALVEYDDVKLREKEK